MQYKYLLEHFYFDNALLTAHAGSPREGARATCDRMAAQRAVPVARLLGLRASTAAMFADKRAFTFGGRIREYASDEKGQSRRQSHKRKAAMRQGVKPFCAEYTQGNMNENIHILF